MRRYVSSRGVRRFGLSDTLDIGLSLGIPPPPPPVHYILDFTYVCVCVWGGGGYQNVHNGEPFPVPTDCVTTPDHTIWVFTATITEPCSQIVTSVFFFSFVDHVILGRGNQNLFKMSYHYLTYPVICLIFIAGTIIY